MSTFRYINPIGQFGNDQENRFDVVDDPAFVLWNCFAQWKGPGSKDEPEEYVSRKYSCVKATRRQRKRTSSLQGLHFVSIVAIFMLFLLKLYPIPDIPDSMSSDVNEEMHRCNGNKPKTPFFDVVAQNLPGTCSIETLSMHLEQILRRYRPACLVVTEASCLKLQHVQFAGYNWIQGTIKGSSNCRVSMYVQDCLSYDVLDNLTCEVPTVGIVLGDFNVCGAYREWTYNGVEDSRKPTCQLNRSINFLEKIRKLKGKSLLIGDFNYCLLEGMSSHQDSLTEIKNLYHDELLASGWSQCIDGVTRVQRGQRSSLLDHCYTRSIEIGRTMNRSIVGTDHHLIGAHVLLRKPLFQPKSYSKRCLDHVTEEMFAKEFLTAHVSEVFAEMDATRALEILEHKITWTLDRVAPVKKYQTRQGYAPWLTPEIREEMKTRDGLRKRAQSSGLDQDWTTYKRMRNQVKHTSMKLKREYLAKKLNVDSSRQMWSRVKNEAGLNKKGKESKIKLKVGDQLLTEEKEVATYLNQFFKDKVVRLEAQTNPSP